MSDTYQAVYDAVRSKIHGGDVGSAVREIAANAFDISWARDVVQQELVAAAYEWRRPSVVFRPNIFPDGTAWCALLGENLQEGIAGFGDTPEDACAAFDKAFWTKKTPQAASNERQTSPEGSDPSDCKACDGFGCVWNNADPTSGQWVACECGDTRGHP